MNIVPVDDPTWAQVTMPWPARASGQLLGVVRGFYLDADGQTRLRVTHFNGEPWPVEPIASDVSVLRR